MMLDLTHCDQTPIIYHLIMLHDTTSGTMIYLMASQAIDEHTSTSDVNDKPGSEGCKIMSIPFKDANVKTPPE